MAVQRCNMAHEYDVFFSYKRDPESDDWHEKVKSKLEYWLKHELQKPSVRIFFDKEEIRTGTRWRQKLSDALKRSRCSCASGRRCTSSRNGASRSG